MKAIPKAPGWFVTLQQFRQRYPGDGFNHDFDQPEQVFSNSDRLGYVLRCPCGQKSYIEADSLHREQGSADVLTCPQCQSWHLVSWKRDLRPQGIFAIQPST